MILKVAIASTSETVVLAATWMHSFFYHSLVSVGGLDQRPVVASWGTATSQNLLAQQQQTSHQMHLPFALQKVGSTTLQQVIYPFWCKVSHIYI